MSVRGVFGRTISVHSIFLYIHTNRRAIVVTPQYELAGGIPSDKLTAASCELHVITSTQMTADVMDMSPLIGQNRWNNREVRKCCWHCARLQARTVAAVASHLQMCKMFTEVEDGGEKEQRV